MADDTDSNKLGANSTESASLIEVTIDNPAHPNFQFEIKPFCHTPQTIYDTILEGYRLAQKFKRMGIRLDDEDGDD